MRGDLLHLIYGTSRKREKDTYLGAFRTRDDALAAIDALKAREMNGRNWADAYHDGGFVVREHRVETDFEFPATPKPRDRFCARVARTSPDGEWTQVRVDVLERVAGGLETRTSYHRNHGMFGTFEPFRQAGRDYALISRDYTRAAVLDLATGEVIAEEPEEADFCPAGFYVPDWWDVHDASILPGSPDWNADNEWPDGTGGFVWGCVWGDDSSWKVQWLDLSRIGDGVLRREERFGYVELATRGWTSPALTLDAPPASGSPPPPFIGVSRDKGRTRVTFSVEMDFDADTGQPSDWRRIRTPFD